jgi:hypothetical protein
MERIRVTKGATKRILVVVVSRRHHANGLLAAAYIFFTDSDVNTESGLPVLCTKVPGLTRSDISQFNRVM